MPGRSSVLLAGGATAAVSAGVSNAAAGVGDTVGGVGDNVASVGDTAAGVGEFDRGDVDTVGSIDVGRERCGGGALSWVLLC